MSGDHDAAPVRISELEQKLSVTFRNKDLLRQAMTHASSEGDSNYERLEFLGDRVLGLVIADLLYDTFPAEPEGSLAKRFAALVQGTKLAEIARDINLNEDLILSEAERNAGGADNDNILADCVEAMLGALYLDQGYAICKDVITRLYGDRVATVKTAPQDPKTTLQERVQGQGLDLPVYAIIERTGPDHAPEFTVEVTVQGRKPARGVGTSRRAAEKKAALQMLEMMDTGGETRE